MNKRKDFKEFLKNKSGVIMDYRFLSVLILWGSSYVYDFLNSIKLIEEKDYKEAKKVIKELKALLIDENLSSLWRYSFVHIWKRSEMTTEEEEKREQEIFKEYYGKKEERRLARKEGFFFAPQKAMPLQLSKLAAQIQKNKPKKDRNEKNTAQTQNPTPTKVKKSLPKIGRNEKITVKYKDGTIKKEVKFKKVKSDLEYGECEIIKVP